VLAPLFACQSTVPLGSECTRFERGCNMDVSHGMPERDAGSVAPVLDAAPAPADAQAPKDAGQDLPAPPDGGPSQPDDAGMAARMGIQNGSFEITSVPPKAGSLDPLTNEPQIAPWRWCAGNIGVDHGFDKFAATDGQWMLSLSFSVGPAVVVQELAKKLVAGTRYAFQIDAARSHDGPDDVRLELIGTNSTCTSATVLAQTPNLGEDSLTTYCLSFVADEAEDHVALRMNPLGLSASVFADNLREVSGCP
jgi:hypothetical protein